MIFVDKNIASIDFSASLSVSDAPFPNALHNAVDPRGLLVMYAIVLKTAIGIFDLVPFSKSSKILITSYGPIALKNIIKY